MSEQNAVALRTPQNEELANVQRLGNLLVASGYFADARDMAQAAVKVMAGQELGIPPIAAMMGINIIKGKVSLGVHLIASRVRAHGYDFRFKRHDKTGCTLEFYSRPDSSGKRQVLGESSFTEDDAKNAGLMGDMYRKYPKNMYYSRAMSNGAKWFTPDVFGGAPVYTPDELGATVDADGYVLEETEPPPPPPKSTPPAPKTTVTAMPPPPPPPQDEPPPPPTERNSISEIQKEAAAIDTGGAPVGTKQAAQNVADRKLAEMQQPKPAEPQQEHVAPAAGKPAVNKLPTGFAEIMKRFEEMKSVLGEENYYNILGEFGVKHANQLGDLKRFQACYDRMIATAKGQAA